MGDAAHELKTPIAVLRARTDVDGAAARRREFADRRARFAAEAGADLGPLKNANQGVIRITGDDGNDYDDGGSRTKRLRVVSTFEYELR